MHLRWRVVVIALRQHWPQYVVCAQVKGLGCSLVMSSSISMLLLVFEVPGDGCHQCYVTQE